MSSTESNHTKESSLLVYSWTSIRKVTRLVASIAKIIIIAAIAVIVSALIVGIGIIRSPAVVAIVVVAATAKRALVIVIVVIAAATCGCCRTPAIGSGSTLLIRPDSVHLGQLNLEVLSKAPVAQEADG